MKSHPLQIVRSKWSLKHVAVVFLATVLIFAPSLSAQDIPSGSLGFKRDIRPILGDYCFTCHGPDAATREGGFRFDVKNSAFGEADSGEHPIVPGDIHASEMIRRMRSTDESEMMPPPEVRKRPTTAQVDLIEKWILEGATWREHWAFKAPERPEPPAVKHSGQVRNPIDQFVISKLESMNMQPAAEADKTTLVRRLFLDLTGLPPTPEQVDEFLADESADAYERLVNRLLASPNYGEHIATSWLDAARFADTNGYQNDFQRSMWLWRDWVIRAYNDNMPYDQFTIEQLAGDMLPDATLEQKIATGFNRNNRSNTEGGSLEEEWFVENVVDRVETTSTVFLGLTVGCARCHDHKFDPISQKEFYQFFAYFDNVDELGVYNEKRGNAGPVVSVATDEFQQQIDALNKQIAAAITQIDELDTSLKSEQKEWEEKLAASQEALLDDDSNQSVLDRFKNVETHKFTDEPVGTAINIASGEKQFLDIGDAFEFDASNGFAVSAWVRPTKYGAIISRMDKQNAYRGFDTLIMPDGRMNVHLIHNWPGNATKITSSQAIPLEQWTHVVVSVSAPGKAQDVQVYFNGRPVEHIVDSDTLNGSTLTEHPVWIGLREDTPPFAGKIAHLKLHEAPLPKIDVELMFELKLAAMVKLTLNDRTDEQQRDLDYQFRLQHPEYRTALDNRNKLERELAELKQQLPTTMVMAERTERRPTYVLARGQYDHPDKSQPVEAGVPAWFPPDKSPSNRLELAQWLVDGENPLTARVAVNHFWARYFGIGLHETPEDFGTQSPLPSHPELLDWLATEFVNSGWDIKQMQRLIVTSATYRQTSSARPETFEADPYNKLLARGPRFRLPAESVRDNALAISGLLTSRIGGPSIKPYQPDGLWEELAGGAGEPPYEMVTDDHLYRRSLYIYRKRTVPHPTMTTFDGNAREICTVARSRTNTPLQALALLNDRTYVEAARNLAMLALDHSEDGNEQVRYAFRRATARWPNYDELRVLTRSLDQKMALFTAEPAKAAEMIQNGIAQPDAKYDPVKLAAMTTVASVILNLDEVITKE